MARRPRDDPSEWDCAICLSIPEGEVHQCHNGHAFCASCIADLPIQRCPTCRVDFPDVPIRSRATENHIAAMPAECQYCLSALTRGELRTHVESCTHRPAVCTAQSSGCVWTGLHHELEAHAASCSYVIFQRMLQPLNAEVVQLRAQLQETSAEVAQLRQQQLQQAEGHANRRIRQMRQRLFELLSDIMEMDLPPGARDGVRKLIRGVANDCMPYRLGISTFVAGGCHGADPSDLCQQARRKLAQAMLVMLEYERDHRLSNGSDRFLNERCLGLSEEIYQLQHGQSVAESLRQHDGE